MNVEVANKNQRGAVARAFDSLRSLVSGIGTSSDKSTSIHYILRVLTPDQLEAMYRGDWIARKIVDIPAEDSTREWRNWRADKKDIEQLEAEEKRLGILPKVTSGLVRARLYGGAVLLMGMKDGNPSSPLNPEAVKKGDLKYVHAASRYELSAGPLQRDITDPLFGEPEYYTYSGATLGSSPGARIHPSRVVRLIGNDLPDPNRHSDGGWGDSVLQVAYDAVRDAGLASSTTASLINEAKVDIISIEGFMERLATAEYSDRLLSRFTLANTAKSMNNALLLDKEEEWQQRQIDFSGLPDLVRMFFLLVSGAADIPVTRMLGQSPAGLSATGDADIRNYYDRLGSEQATKLTPALTRLDEVMVRSALGDFDPGIWYEWAPLWQMDDAQKAEIAGKKAEVYKIDVETGLIDPDVLRDARISQLTEDGTYPGLEQAVEEHGAESDLDEDDGEVSEQFEAMDARPRTLYVRRDVLNGDEIAAWAKEQGFVTTLPADKMHVTIAFSRQPIDWAKVGTAWNQDKDGKMSVAPGGMRLVETFGGGATVLLFAANELTWRHQEICHCGASWDWSEYQPHVTISYDLPEVLDVDEIEPYRGPIRLGPEVFEEIDEDWKDRLEEKDGFPFVLDVEQPRHPKGSEQGGQFASAGGSGAGSLTDDQAGAVAYYTDQGYYGVNTYHRTEGDEEAVKKMGQHIFPGLTGKGSRGVDRRKEYLDDVTESLDGAIASSSPFDSDTVLYRGVNNHKDAFGMPVGDIRPGMEFVDRGYMSTSRDRGAVRRFGGSSAHGGTISIRAPAGTRALDLTGDNYNSVTFAGESEVVFGRGTRMRVVSVGSVGFYGGGNIEVEIVP